MSTVSLTYSMPKPVSRVVRRLRWLVRLYVVLEGLAALAVVLGGAFWIGLAIDWTFEPTRAVRVAMWVAVCLAVVYVVARFLLARAARRLSNASMALLLERSYPEFGESLVTTVEAAERRRETPVGNEVLLRHTSEEAAAALQRVSLGHIFQFLPLFWKLAVAISLGVAITTFSLLHSEAFGFWLERIQLSESLWPRRVQLSVAGFSDDAQRRIVNVARDDDWQLEVLASILGKHGAPGQVEIRYRLADGRRGSQIMTKIGEAIPGRDETQRFRYTFKKIASDITFDVIGGDDRIRNLQLYVVERPQILRILMECEFPAYMQRKPQMIPVSGRVELPEGSRAVCRIESNKRLTEVTVHDPALQEDLSTTIAESRPQEASFRLDAGSEDRVLLVTMQDSDGVENREPYRIVVSVVPDQPPEVSVQVRAIGTAVTPQARLPLAGRISDEYGIERAWYEYQVDENQPERRTLVPAPEGRRELTELGQFDLAETDDLSNRRLLELQPGQRISVSVQAQDAYNLRDEPHIGRSQKFSLDIVTNSELRALLEKRELALRQRFEAIYEKMLATRGLLDRIDVTPAEQTPKPPSQEEQQRLKERDRLRIGGALQNVVQLEHETMGVADGFDEIAAEMVNNRVDTAELKQRLEEGIAAPLRAVGSRLMPALEIRLQELESHFSSKSKGPSALDAAKTQGDLVLQAMKRILDRMLELESYNELVELLRDIVSEHQDLRDQTKAERRAKLRGLLDND